MDEIVAALTRETSKPVSAYEVVHILAGRGERVAAPQVYRSLGRLRDEGVVRKIESLNAFCAASEDDQAILYCEVCGRHEARPVSRAVAELRQLALRLNYDLSRIVIELCGRCRECSSSSGLGAP